MARIGTALISVSDKTGVAEFTARLHALGVAVISTGGTSQLLREHGLDVLEVADYTGFPEILGGRVKTLHPKLHGGLLARRELEGDLRELAEHGIRTIDMVVSNLYPFGDVIRQPGVEMGQALESIDIGGVSLIRAAAKNYTHVAVVTSPEDYDAVAAELEAGGGSLGQQTHYDLAVRAFRHTAHYDTAIADYLSGIEAEPHRTGFDTDEVLVITGTIPTEAQMDDLAAAWSCLGHAAPCGAVVVRDGATLAVGAARASASEAVLAALSSLPAGMEGSLALACGARLERADGLTLAARAGVKALAMPAGPGEDVVRDADELGIALVVVGGR